MSGTALDRMDVAKAEATYRVRADEAFLLELSGRIHAHPEVGFEETRAAGWVADALRSAGFDVAVGSFGLATSIDASIGDGPLVLTLCAEYDALPGLGHGCGHNIIASAAVGAARSLAPLADELGVRLRLLGTPAEEGGGGKILMMDRGAFDGVHAALMIHPGVADLPYMPSLATTRLSVEFRGVAAHASASPHRGVNAADAATIAQVAIGLLRQHMPAESRVHGIVTHGGDAPNVVPDRTTMDFLVRAANEERLATLEARVRACFEAGATGAGAAVEVSRSMPVYADLAPDPGLTAAYAANSEALGRLQQEMTERVMRSAGSTDMGNVSHLVPSIHPMIGLGREAGGLHSSDFEAAAGAPAGDAATIDGAIVLAHTVIDAALDADLRTHLLSGNPR